MTLTLEHIHLWLHPQVYIVESEENEDMPFSKSIKQHAQRHDAPFIRLSPNALQTMRWMTRLDTASLSVWHKTTTEILIRASSAASGSFIRLLRSIERADYFGVRPPHITIELPPQVNQDVDDFLESFVWPPLDSQGSSHASQVKLLRRTSLDPLDPNDASVRYIEAFWPARTRDSHVILLSQDVELSPMYYHYLFYNLLEYKHSNYASGTRDSESLMGISLINPSSLLDEQTPFTPPSSDSYPKSDDRYSVSDQSDTTYFQWQAPDTHACLYFGDKWKEIHSFLSLRVGAGEPRSKLVSATTPAYAEYFLELMRARSYFVLYPGMLDEDLATAHKELFTVPEEFSGRRFGRLSAGPSSQGMDELDLDEPLEVEGDFLVHERPAPPRPHLEVELAWTPLHVLLPSTGDLPELSSIPMLDYMGQIVTRAEARDNAQGFTEKFVSSVGGCTGGATPPRRHGFSTADLFCDTERARARTDRTRTVSGSESGSSSGRSTGHGRYGSDTHRSSGRHRGSSGSMQRTEQEPRDEDGVLLSAPVSAARQKAMSDEFAEHLRRQGRGAARDRDSKEKEVGSDSAKEAEIETPKKEEEAAEEEEKEEEEEEEDMKARAKKASAASTADKVAAGPQRQQEEHGSSLDDGSEFSQAWKPQQIDHTDPRAAQAEAV